MRHISIEIGRTKDNDTGCSVSDLFVLRPRQLNHRLGSGMSYINFSENGMSVIGKTARQSSSHLTLNLDGQDTAHGVENHLQHSFGSQTCPDNICYCL